MRSAFRNFNFSLLLVSPAVFRDQDANYSEFMGFIRNDCLLPHPCETDISATPMSDHQFFFHPNQGIHILTDWSNKRESNASRAVNGWNRLIFYTMLKASRSLSTFFTGTRVALSRDPINPCTIIIKSRGGVMCIAIIDISLEGPCCDPFFFMCWPLESGWAGWLCLILTRTLPSVFWRRGLSSG